MPSLASTQKRLKGSGFLFSVARVAAHHNERAGGREFRQNDDDELKSGKEKENCFGPAANSSWPAVAISGAPGRPVPSSSQCTSIRHLPYDPLPVVAGRQNSYIIMVRRWPVAPTPLQNKCGARVCVTGGRMNEKPVQV